MQEEPQNTWQMVFNSWFVPSNLRVLSGTLTLKLCHFGLVSIIQNMSSSSWQSITHWWGAENPAWNTTYIPCEEDKDQEAFIFIPVGILLFAAGRVEGGKWCLMEYPGYGPTPLAFIVSHPCQVWSRTQQCIFLEIVHIPVLAGNTLGCWLA